MKKELLDLETKPNCLWPKFVVAVQEGNDMRASVKKINKIV